MPKKQTGGSSPPKIIPGRPGYSSFSLEALQERIEAQVQEEIAGRPDILLEARDEAARREMVHEAGNYVLAVEAVMLTASDKESLFDAVYRSLFTFGPLDDLLADDLIVDMTIDGYDHIHVRRFGGKPEAVPSPFDDAYSYARVLDRMLTGAGAQIVESEPFIEVGMTLLGRPARMTLVGPPLSPVLHVDLRLHPHQAATLASLQSREAIGEVEAALLRELTGSRHGFLIVGDAAAGKTTLLEALLPHLPELPKCWLVERTVEIRPPEGIEQLAAVPAREDQPGIDFAAKIGEALAKSPQTLILDELRGDEAGSVWEALTMANGPRCVFAMRSSPLPHRLRSAFSILIRKAHPALDQAAINRALLERLPFVVATQIGGEGMRITAISEWTQDSAGDVALIPLVKDGQRTDQRSERGLT